VSEKKTLLLEILTEEIPSRFVPGALRQLEENGARILQENRLGYEKIISFGTPRRLVFLASGVDQRQKPAVERKKGPSCQAAFSSDGSPNKAALGFARGQGLQVEDLVVEKVGEVPYLFAVKEIPGEYALDILPSLMKKLISSLSFPKNMYWTSERIRFARPIRGIVCLFGEDIVPFSFAGVTANNETVGHRFLAPGPWMITSADNYLEVMDRGKVMADHRQRELFIRQSLEEAAASLGGKVLMDEGLLQEVNFLVESPAIITGSFPEEYLALPRQVPVTVMQVHQKYFAVEDKDGKLLPNFIAVVNGKYNNMELIKAGNEKVLRARLKDARFFYDEDRRRPLVDFVEKLESIVYQGGMGTMLEKTERMKRIARHIMDITGTMEDEEVVLRAVHLAKADLVTQMVREFPELQGVMGKTYALEDGESPAVAEAIFEHYLPRFAGDSLPATRAGILVALSDKFDHLVSCFAAGIRPSGSQDPYALRRAGLGIVQIIIEKKLSFSLPLLVQFLLNALEEQGVAVDNGEKLKEDVLSFLELRLRHYLQERSFSYDIIEAVLGANKDDFLAICKKAEFLTEKRQSKELAEAAAAYQRVANLACKAEGAPLVQEKLLEEPEELALWQKARQVEGTIAGFGRGGDFTSLLQLLAALKAPIDNFFDKVMVMAEDEKIRGNRLALLRYLQKLFLSLADLGKLMPE